LSQIRDLLGHHSIVTTERYDTQTADALMASARLLENGGTFTIPSQSGDEHAESGHDNPVESVDNDVKGKRLEDGVDDGTRTRNVRSHSPVLYL
jgi:hypothetical protein